MGVAGCPNKAICGHFCPFCVILGHFDRTPALRKRQAAVQASHFLKAPLKAPLKARSGHPRTYFALTQFLSLQSYRHPKPNLLGFLEGAGAHFQSGCRYRLAFRVAVGRLDPDRRTTVVVRLVCISPIPHPSCLIYIHMTCPPHEACLLGGCEGPMDLDFGLLYCYVAEDCHNPAQLWVAANCCCLPVVRLLAGAVPCRLLVIVVSDNLCFFCANSVGAANGDWDCTVDPKVLSTCVELGVLGGDWDCTVDPSGQMVVLGRCLYKVSDSEVEEPSSFGLCGGAPKKRQRTSSTRLMF